MPADSPNLSWVRSLKLEGHPEFGAKLFELLSSFKGNLDTLEQQTNSNLNGTPAPPPNIESVTVSPTAVGHHISINHGAAFYRGLFYHVESADNPHFTNPYPEYSGPAREINLATGPRRLYFQVFASYQNSGNTRVIFHGGANPQSVIGGTAYQPAPSQGGGTSRPGEGRAGFGAVPYRGNLPPTRNK
jgi:hypothetical protein